MRTGTLAALFLSSWSGMGCLAVYHCTSEETSLLEEEIGRAVAEAGAPGPWRLRGAVEEDHAGLRVRAWRERDREELVDIRLRRTSVTRCPIQGPVIYGMFGEPTTRATFTSRLLFALDVSLVAPALVDLFFFSTSEHATTQRCPYQERQGLPDGLERRSERRREEAPASDLALRAELMPGGRVDLMTDGTGTARLRLSGPSPSGPCRVDVRLSTGEILTTADLSPSQARRLGQ